MDKKTGEAFSLLESLLNFNGKSPYLVYTNFDTLYDVSLNCFIKAIDKVKDEIPDCYEIMIKRMIDKKTLKELSTEYGVSSERIRQKAHKAVRFIVLYCDVNRAVSAKELKKALKENSRMENIIKNFMPGYNVKDDPKLKRIEELDLSLRTYNCLARNGYYTLADLIDAGADLYAIRNMGEKSAKELRKKVLEKWGYCI